MTKNGAKTNSIQFNIKKANKQKAKKFDEKKKIKKISNEALNVNDF